MGNTVAPKIFCCLPNAGERQHRPEPGVPLLGSHTITFHSPALILRSKGLKIITRGNGVLTFLSKQFLYFSDCLECPLDI